MVAALLEKSASPLPPTLKKYKSERIIGEDIMAHLREKNEYWRTPEFIRFTNTQEYRVLKFLMAHIVRDKGLNAGTKRMYNDWYKKRMLCAWFSTSEIGRYFEKFYKDGNPNKSWVCYQIRKLENMKLLIKRPKYTKFGKINVYQLGDYIGTPGQEDYQETLYFDLYFSGLAEIAKRQRHEERMREYSNDISDELKKDLEATIISLDEMRQARASKGIAGKGVCEIHKGCL